jgi:hypothetical protein
MTRHDRLLFLSAACVGAGLTMMGMEAQRRRDADREQVVYAAGCLRATWLPAPSSGTAGLDSMQFCTTRAAWRADTLVITNDVRVRVLVDDTNLGGPRQ